MTQTPQQAAATAAALKAAAATAAAPKPIVEGASAEAVAEAFKENGPPPAPKTSEELQKAVQSATSMDTLMALMQNMMLQQQRMMEDNAALRAQMQKMQAPDEDLDDTPAEFEKTYYHPTEGSTIVVSRKGPNGEAIAEVHTFWGGKITSQDRVVQRFLDSICDNGSSPVSSKPVRGKHAEMDEAAQEVVRSAARSIDKVMGSKT